MEKSTGQKTILPQPFDANLWRQTQGGEGLVSHLLSEQNLHVQEGDHWHSEKFGQSTLDERFNPQNSIQFTLPYVEIPEHDLTTLETPNAKQMIEKNPHDGSLKIFFSSFKSLSLSRTC